MSWVHRCMIVPAAQAPLAQALAAGLAGDAGAGMWITPLSASGNAPASHYISTGLIQDEFAALLADANATYAACQSAKQPVTLAQCQGLLAASDISADAPFVAMARLGLKLIQAEL